MRIPIIVQAKKYSTRVPFKNNIVLPGHLFNLTEWALFAASQLQAQIGLESDVILTTGFTPAIADNLRRLYPSRPFSWLPRPKFLDGDHNSNRLTILHALSSFYDSEQLDLIKSVVILQPSAPFRHAETIEHVAEIAVECKENYAFGGAYHIIQPETIFWDKENEWEFRDNSKGCWDEAEQIDIDTYDGAFNAARVAVLIGQTRLEERICTGQN